MKDTHIEDYNKGISSGTTITAKKIARELNAKRKEIICDPIRKDVVEWKDIQAILESYGVEFKTPF